MLQCHPCYIIELINQHFFKNKTEFVRFVKALYNRVTNMSDSRIIHLLTCLANNLIKMDMPYIDINEIHQAIKQTYFYPVFRIIFKSQKCNKRYTQIFVKNLIDELIIYSKDKLLTSKFFNGEDAKKDQIQGDLEQKRKEEELKKQNGEESKNLNDIGENASPKYETKKDGPLVEAKQIDLMGRSPGGEENKDGKNNKDESVLPQKKDAEELKEKPNFYAFNLEIHPSKEKQKHLKNILKKLTDKMAKSLYIGEQQSDRLEERTFSCEIIWLLQKVKKALLARMNKDKNEDDKSIFESQIASLNICKLIIYF